MENESVHKKRVLVVDDDRGILTFLSIKLRLCGYETIAANNGEKALELVRTENPDIILLDILMPGIDGYEVLQRMRVFSRLPVIVASAKGNEADKALRLGANGFASKPFDMQRLLQKIGELVDQPLAHTR